MPLLGKVQVPGDKSTTHRALMLGAIADGRTRMTGALQSEDTLATVRALQSLGVSVEQVHSTDSAEWCVTGLEVFSSEGGPLDCQNAGTAARLFLGLLAGRQGKWTLDGDTSLRGRPFGDLVRLLGQMGAQISGDELPLTIEGCALMGGIHHVEVPSAQIKSALLFSGLVADGPTTVVQHVATRDHTERLFARFGIPVHREPGKIIVEPCRPVATELTIPGDPSSAAFFVVAAILVPGSEIRLTDVGLWPRRLGFLSVLDRAGADVMILSRQYGGQDGPLLLGETARTEVADDETVDPRGDLRAGSSELDAFEILPEEVPDLVDEIPVLAVAAARARGISRFRGLSALRSKESDRVEGVLTLLRGFGVPVEMQGEDLLITGVEKFQVSAPVPRFADHRLVMAQAVACVAGGIPLDRGGGETKVSYPEFWIHLEGLLGAEEVASRSS